VPTSGPSIARRPAVGERIRGRARREVIVVGSAVVRGVIGGSPARSAGPASGPARIRSPYVGAGTGKRSPGEGSRIGPVGGGGIRHLGMRARIRPPHVGSCAGIRPPHVGSCAGIRPPHVGSCAGIRPPQVGVAAGKSSVRSRARIGRAGAAARIVSAGIGSAAVGPRIRTFRGAPRIGRARPAVGVRVVQRVGVRAGGWRVAVAR
jgi:hypothetical protein